MTTLPPILRDRDLLERDTTPVFYEEFQMWSNDVKAVPMHETPMQLERIYGKKIAEQIEMDDELAHRWDY